MKHSLYLVLIILFITPPLSHCRTAGTNSHVITVKNGTHGAIDISFTLEGTQACHAFTRRIDSGDRKEFNIDLCCVTSYKIMGKTGEIAGLEKVGVLTSSGVDKKAFGMASCSDQTFTVIQVGGNNINPLVLDTVNGIQ